MMLRRRPWTRCHIGGGTGLPAYVAVRAFYNRIAIDQHVQKHWLVILPACIPRMKHCRGRYMLLLVVLSLLQSILEVTLKYFKKSIFSVVTLAMMTRLSLRRRPRSLATSRTLCDPSAWCTSTRRQLQRAVQQPANVLSGAQWCTQAQSLVVIAAVHVARAAVMACNLADTKFSCTTFPQGNHSLGKHCRVPMSTEHSYKTCAVAWY